MMRRVSEGRWRGSESKGSTNSWMMGRERERVRAQGNLEWEMSISTVFQKPLSWQVIVHIKAHQMFMENLFHPLNTHTSSRMRIFNLYYDITRVFKGFNFWDIGSISTLPAVALCRYAKLDGQPAASRLPEHWHKYPHLASDPTLSPCGPLQEDLDVSRAHRGVLFVVLKQIANILVEMIVINLSIFLGDLSGLVW